MSNLLSDLYFLNFAAFIYYFSSVEPIVIFCFECFAESMVVLLLIKDSFGSLNLYVPIFYAPYNDGLVTLLIELLPVGYCFPDSIMNLL